VRAFGCLVEDLLQRINGSEVGSFLYNGLCVLKNECLSEDIRLRPNFAEISERLQVQN